MADTDLNEPIDQIDLLVKEDENVLRDIITNTPEEDTKFGNNLAGSNLLTFIGSKVGKVYQDLMMKLNIVKMDLYSFHNDYQEFLKADKEYKDANDIDKLNIKQSIIDLRNWIGTIDDFKNNLK